jgi:4'-phosphopantetheinyl transferase EntD
MIERLVPAEVATAETREDLAETLFPDELAALARAVEKRRVEFRSVRACARQALAALGVERPPMVPGPAGAPRWPAGIVGSMTHCRGYRAAAVARAVDLASIGIDAEPHEQLPGDVLDLVASPAEAARLRQHGDARPGIHWDRVLFSAKESIYKAWYPLQGVWLGFEDVDVVLGAEFGGFDVRIVNPDLAEVRWEFRGRWLVEGGLIVTSAVAVPRRAGSGGFAPAREANREALPVDHSAQQIYSAPQDCGPEHPPAESTS